MSFACLRYLRMYLTYRICVHHFPSSFGAAKVPQVKLGNHQSQPQGMNTIPPPAQINETLNDNPSEQLDFSMKQEVEQILNAGKRVAQAMARCDVWICCNI